MNDKTLTAPPPGNNATRYGYDNKDQLQHEVVEGLLGYNNSFVYDAVGNPTTFKGVTKTYNANNQQTGTGFVHDNNGNPTTYNGTTLTFDAENRLTSYGTTLTAGYTGDGLRAWKQTTSGGRIYYLYDGTLPLMEVGGGNANLIRPLNTYGAAGLVSRVTGEAPQVGGAQSEFYAFDPQGSVAARVDAGGHTMSTESYSAHGAAVNGGASVWGYGAQWGYQTDAESGLQLLTNRYYDPSNGRFLTRDPISYAGGVNLYAYVGNNPVNEIDSDGLSPRPFRKPRFKGGRQPGGPRTGPRLHGDVPECDDSMTCEQIQTLIGALTLSIGTRSLYPELDDPHILRLDYEAHALGNCLIIYLEKVNKGECNCGRKEQRRFDRGRDLVPERRIPPIPFWHLELGPPPLRGPGHVYPRF